MQQELVSVGSRLVSGKVVPTLSSGMTAPAPGIDVADAIGGTPPEATNVAMTPTLNANRPDLTRVSFAQIK
jgi:hypothetical protein